MSDTIIYTSRGAIRLGESILFKDITLNEIADICDRLKIKAEFDFAKREVKFVEVSEK